MKLGSLKNGRDGSLVLVKRDLSAYLDVSHICPTMQNLLDNWTLKAPQLHQLSQELNQGLHDKNTEAFDPKKMAAPLPRAYQWIDGSAYVNHVELVRKARGAEMPPSFWTDPLMYQGCSDAMLGPCDDILVADESWGIDFEAEVAVITDDVPMGTRANFALEHVRLVCLVNDVSLRNLIPAELAKGFGFFQSKPASSFSPVAVTIDELGGAWREGKLHLPLRSTLNGKLVGQPNAGVDMTFNFAQLLEHAAKTRVLGAGTILGSGTVSNYDRRLGSSCLAEKRMLELIEFGEARTPFMRFNDRIHIEMRDAEGASLFGAIDQCVRPYLIKDK